MSIHVSTPTPVPSIRSANFGVVVPIHVTDGADIVEFMTGTAANGCPVPEPGMYGEDGRIYYVTARGQVYLVRTADALATLQMRESLPSGAEPVEEDDYDRQLCILAEAADALDADAIEPGLYEGDGHLYYVGDAGVFLLYRAAGHTDFHTVGLAELPASAVRIDDDRLHTLPGRLFEAVDCIEETAERSPGVLL